jgi:hypothetical protein
MKKKWLVATYKINEVKRVESNLLNQKFDYYLPKITIKKINANPKWKCFFLATFLLILVLKITQLLNIQWA